MTYATHKRLRTGLWLSLAGLSVACFSNCSPQAAPKTLSVAAQADDLVAFRRSFLDPDRAFSKSARALAERRLSQLQRRATPVGTAEFIVALCRITALADNGHSSCTPSRAPEITLSFGVIGGDFYVLGVPAADLELLGAQLIAIDGHGMAELVPAVRSLFGGVPARRDLRAVNVLARPELLHALNMSGSSESATYRVRTPSGVLIERTVVAAKRGSDWTTLPRAGLAPWALREADQPFRWRDAADLDAVIVQMRQNLDAPKQKVAGFLEDAERHRAQLGRRNVVLDMRQNSGGDFLTTRDFMLAWPGRLAAPGRFFVLIGPATFSAGIASVAYLKQAGGTRVILVGDPVGDRLTFFAEGKVVKLPHSGLEVLPATQRDDFAPGCRGYGDCFAAIAQPGAPTGTPAELAGALDQKFGRRPLYVSSLEPDLRASWSLSDYETGRDPAIAAVSDYLRTPVQQ